MKKKIVFPLVAIIVSSIFYVGCLKQGPDDPFLSIYSRKMRLTGDWTITSFAINGIEHIKGDTTYNLPAGACGTDTLLQHHAVNYTISIVKDGTFSSSSQDSMITTETFTTPGTGCTNGTTTNVSSIDTASGTWEFRGADGYKKKEQLMLKSSGDSTIYDIVRLANKEIHLSYSEISGTDTTKYDLLLTR